MTSAPHAEGRQFDPGQVYLAFFSLCVFFSILSFYHLGPASADEIEGQGRGRRPEPSGKLTFVETWQYNSRVEGLHSSIAQLVEHALRKRMVVGSIPTGGLLAELTTNSRQ